MSTVNKTFFYYCCQVCDNSLLLPRHIDLVLVCPICGRETLSSTGTSTVVPGFTSIADHSFIPVERPIERSAPVVVVEEPFPDQTPETSREQKYRERKIEYQRQRRSENPQAHAHRPKHKCPYCEDEFDGRGFRLHVSRCLKNPDRSKGKQYGIPVGIPGGLPPKKADTGAKTKNEPITAQSFGEFAAKMEKARDNNSLTVKRQSS